MSKFLYCDLESYCEVPIKCGANRYAEEAEILLFPYALGDADPTVLDFTAPGFNFKSTELYDMLHDPDITTVWHNGSMFDRHVLQFAAGVDLPYPRVHDTMVQAYVGGLPGKLEVLCDVFELDEEIAKSKEGKRLIKLFCVPQPKNRKLRRATRETHPEDWDLFLDYAYRDILSMRKLHKLMPMWNMKLPDELALWHLDQKINDRGFMVDKELARVALAAVDEAKAEMNERINLMTGGEVESGTQRAALLNFVNDQLGQNLDDMKGATLDRVIETTDDEFLRDLLKMRRAVGGTAVSKFQTLLDAVSADGRLRGCLQFAGAGRTSRWSGRVFQPQNLPRPDLPSETIEAGIEALVAGESVDDVVRLCTNAVRGAIVAPPGKKLVVSDLSNIEGRVAAWLAGEEWKLDAFRAYDNKTGHDLYAVAYAKAFDVTPEEVMENKKNGDGIMRQIGKVMELMLQYEGGVGAFLTGADTYGIDLDDLAERAYHLIPDDVRSEARSAWGWAVKERRTQGLKEKAYVVCDSLKRMWRRQHPEIQSYWTELLEAAMSAVLNPGTVFRARKLKFYCKGPWLRMVLPSGRSVVYARPHVKDGKLRYWGVNPKTKKWQVESTYGGKLFENACQAVARDVMGANMPAIEAALYAIILSVHDELLTETPDTEEFTAEGLSRLLSTNPPWADGLPLAAGGFEAHRYKKD